MANVVTKAKGKWFYGRRVKSSGAPPVKHKRRRFIERPEDRCQKHHAYRAGCGCKSSGEKGGQS